VAFFGQFQYDDFNTASQEAYSLADFSAGVERKGLLVELWVKNAFDSRYFPVAFAYGQLAPSGFIAETGRPRTWGVSSGIFILKTPRDCRLSIQIEDCSE
jgi:outer membrane receptor protein involved in Fe transport